jgi:hypothetical protein
MATGASVDRAASGLGNGRTERARNIRSADSGASVEGPDSRSGALAVATPGEPGGVALADGAAGAAQALEWDRAANIHVRMIRAQADAKALERTKPKAGSEGAKFLANGYVTHDVVTHEAVRILTAQGIHFQPYLRSHAQDGNRTVIDMEGVFTNVDNPEEKLSFLGFGYGVDGSDKGPGKAMSYAKKMVLSQALMLNTHEDIETHSTNYEPRVAATVVREAEAVTDAAIRTWADAYNAALKGCATKKDLASLRAQNAHMMKSPAVPEVTKDYFIDMISQLEGSLP